MSTPQKKKADRAHRALYNSLPMQMANLKNTGNVSGAYSVGGGASIEISEPNEEAAAE